MVAVYFGMIYVTGYLIGSLDRRVMDWSKDDKDAACIFWPFGLWPVLGKLGQHHGARGQLRRQLRTRARMADQTGDGWHETIENGMRIRWKEERRA
jgi:hypothetical protein